MLLGLVGGGDSFSSRVPHALLNIVCDKLIF